MDIFPNWGAFSQKENDKVEHELSETEDDEYQHDNYEHNNGKDRCHNSDNLPVQVRPTILDNRDIGDRIKPLNFK